MNKRQGLGPVAIIVILAILIGGGYALYKYSSRTSSAAKDITLSQLRNASIPDFASSGEGTTTLTNGKWSYNQGNLHFSTELNTATSSYAYGDLNGDGALDMAVTFVENTGGNGYFNYLAVFVNQKGTPHYIASASLGDRVTINKISIDNGTILADILTQGPNEGLCCPTFHEIIQYAVVTNSLVEIGVIAPESTQSFGVPIVTGAHAKNAPTSWIYHNNTYGFELALHRRFFLEPNSINDHIDLSFKSFSSPVRQGIYISPLGTTSAQTFETYVKQHPITEPNSGKVIPFSGFKEESLGAYTFYHLPGEWYLGFVSQDYYLLHGGNVWRFGASAQGVDYDNRSLYGENDEVHVALKKSLTTLKFAK
ncbi:MAG: VCBS repeat-containing protein [Candidatus Taylorbacteria bacterium]|nr:VCBS repeat-containing protein [Candidatus Taylorbacteria bacterium]